MTSQFKLEGPVSATDGVDPGDSRKVKQALVQLGFLDRSELASADFVDSATLAGLKAFQRHNGLVADGVAKAGGPTERLIDAGLRERNGGASVPAFALFGSVGTKGDNRVEDVRNLKRALATAGYFPAEKARAPSGRVDDDLELGIRSFQRDFNLERDGLLHPGGKTEKTLDRVIEPASPAERKVAGAAIMLDRRKRGLGKKEEKPKPVPPISQAFLDEWRKKGFGGPRGELRVPTLRNEAERIENVLANKPARFNIEDSPDADASSPLHEIKSIGIAAIERYGKIMEEEARKQGVDPNLVKAISFSENARGHYLGMAEVFEKLDLAKSIFPMNIRPDIWGKLDPSKADFTDPRTNIRAGVRLIKRITDRIEDPTPEKIATLWNSIRQEEVIDFGAYVGRMFRERPWEQ